MVKADAKRNYYADLELTPAADTEEIKKQFRKLARLYHPDRNPGKEVEYVPKFQAIQAAHEILSDPEQRNKYDADRRRMGYGAGGAGGSSRPAPPPRAGQTNFAGRSPYEAYSNFPPPRMRTSANPQRERPQSYAAPPSGSTRPPPPPPPPPPFARGPAPPPPPRQRPQSYAQDDSGTNQRRNVFTAWEQMRHKQNQESTWSDDDGLRKARAANDANNAHQSKPGLGRSHTTRAPRKGGFDPNARLSGDWEPAARSSSAYQSSPRPARPSAPSPPPPTAHGEKPKPRPDPLGQFRSKLGPDDVPYNEGQRVRTPYASEGIGQKTYFTTENLSRSSSMRDAPDLARKAGSKNSPRANAARHRSASPIGRNAKDANGRRASAQHSAKKNPMFNVGYSDTDPSSAEEPSSPASDTSTKPMSGMANGAKPRRTAKPGSYWQGRSDSPLKDQTSGAAAEAASGSAVPGVTPTFSFSNVEDGSSAQQSRSNSADNIDTGFNAKAWDGTFQGSTFSPPPVGRGPRRGSPPRRKASRPPVRSGLSTENTSESWPAGSQKNPIDLSAPGFKVPPPPPFPPNGTPVPPGSAGQPPNSAGSSQGGVPLTEHPGFRSDDWLKKQTFFFPQPGEARPPSPGKQAPPASTRKGKMARPRKQSKGENTLHPQAATASDAEGESSSDPGMHKTKSAPAGMSMDGDAMDIDPEPSLSSSIPVPGPSKSTSPKVTREPRLVNVQPNRPEWRESSGTGISPPGAVPNMNGGIPPGTIPSAVPNAAVPGPPPPPPGPPPTTSQTQPQTQASNTKTKRDASSSSTLNFDSFRSAAPFAPSTNGQGLSGLQSDLAGTLPFESQAASLQNQPRQLELPLPPKAPTPPSSMRIPQSVWKEYMASMSFYMGAFYQFEEQMLSHFTTRHRNAARFGTGVSSPTSETSAESMRLLEALGDGTGEGYASYLRGLHEDVRVQKHWDVAREKHRDAVEALLDFKKRVALNVVKIVPAGFGGV